MESSALKSGKLPMAPQRSLSRRVSFNENTILKPHHRAFVPSEDGDAEAQQGSRHRKGCGSICNSCCAWVSLVIGILLLLVLLFGGVYFSFLQSNLPDIRIHRLDVYTLNVTNTNSDTFLTTDFEVALNATNRNSRIELSYSPMTATIMSEGINLGTVRLPAFSQAVESATDIKVRTSVNQIPVEEAAGSELSRKSNFHLMVVSVYLKGHIDFTVNGNKMNGFPLKISCDNIDQSEIDNGHAPRCSAKLSPFH